MPPQPDEKDDGYSYPARTVLSSFLSSATIALAGDYYPQEIAFVPESLQFTPPSSETPPWMDPVYLPSTSSRLLPSPPQIALSIPTGFRSVPIPSASSSVVSVVPEPTAPLPPAFHTSTPFRYVSPELPVVSCADTAAAVQQELAELRNVGPDCGLDISTSLRFARLRG